MVQGILFYAFAAIIVLSALAMVMSRNLVHSALFMAAAFLGMAFIYLLLQADYVAVVQILVYVGAISVLFVFGIMLTKRARMEDTNRFNRYGFLAVLIGVGLFALLARAIVVSHAVAAQTSAPSADTPSRQLPHPAARSRSPASSLATWRCRLKPRASFFWPH